MVKEVGGALGEGQRGLTGEEGQLTEDRRGQGGEQMRTNYNDTGERRGSDET